jgi:hypothetical protein
VLGYRCATSKKYPVTTTWEPCSGIWKYRQTKERKLSPLLAGSCSPEKRKYLTFDALKKKSQKSNR